ncbi:MAG: hypothetical protein M1448_01255 [Candidatus Marsarchaeota archaeon]|nr:hypothetical protein [Candidatus Marsarchaeota archaeon]
MQIPDMSGALQDRKTAISAIGAAMAAALVAAVYLSAGGNAAPAIAVPALGIYAIMLYADRIFVRREEEREERASLSDTLALMHRNAWHFRKPLRNCIDEALCAMKGRGGARDALSEARRRLDLGEEIGFALHAAGRGEGNQLSRVWGDGNAGTWEYIGSVVERMRSEAAAEGERAAEAMQRHTSVAVVVGTVVPSLLLFAFTGYSIVESSGYLFYAFAFMIGGVVPFAYSIAQMQLVDPYG